VKRVISFDGLDDIAREAAVEHRRAERDEHHLDRHLRTSRRTSSGSARLSGKMRGAWATTIA